MKRAGGKKQMYEALKDFRSALEQLQTCMTRVVDATEELQECLEEPSHSKADTVEADGDWLDSELSSKQEEEAVVETRSECYVCLLEKSDGRALIM
jgi:DNA-binding transcriptional regulator GbsR (MarR family)